jgi:NADH dehydrogenase
MNFFTKLKIKFSCKSVGCDEFGNQYFISKNNKRFVIYRGIAEPTKIPCEWHGWIHYTTNDTPMHVNTHKYSWQKIHLPNLTGTKNSYSPRNSNSIKTNSIHKAWEPNNL